LGGERELFLSLDTERLRKIMMLRVNVATERYLPWDELRYRTPPDDLTHEEWWLAIRLARS
jgi:hypothetical protein